MENYNTQINYITHIKPDLIIKYNEDENINLPICVIYVRPRTNVVSYETAILKGVQPYARVIYMANLNGKMFLKNAIILEHYACEYRFAIYAKQEISKYPEMIKKFEEYFKIKFIDAKIISSFDAVLLLSMTPQDLFDIFVEDKDFLKFYGQTIKKIKGFYIVNYDIPALINKYDLTTNIFVIAVSFNENCSSFKQINESIINEMRSDKNVKIIDEEKFHKLSKIAQVKRTYHISRNHIRAMYDMSDFIFDNDGEQLKLTKTPLGKILINNGVSENQLKYLKEYPLIRVHRNNKKILVNIIDECQNKNIDQILNLFKSIETI